jgi:AcrR family transcriptional regulator
MCPAKPKPEPLRGGARAGAGRPRDLEAAQAILDKTLVLLEKHGYEGLGVDAVAAAAGVAKTTIYRHWSSKPELVAAAARPLFQELAEAPLRGNVHAELVQLLEYVRSLMSGRSGRILRILLREAGPHAPVNELVQPAIYRRRRLFAQVLNRAIARGELRADLDQELVVDLLLGPLWVRATMTAAPIPADLPEQVVDGVLRGIRAAGKTLAH